MKKSILLLICFVSILFVNLSAKAEILPEGEYGIYSEASYYNCSTYAEFNYLIGRDTIPEDDYYLECLNSVIAQGGKTSVRWDGAYTDGTNNHPIDFYCLVDCPGLKAKKISYVVGQTTVYEATIQSDGSFKATKNTPVDLNAFNGSRNKLFKMEKSTNYYNIGIDFTSHKERINHLFYIVFSTMFGYKVFENDKYQNSDVYFIVDSCHPLTNADIISSLSVSDKTCGKISASNIKIIDSEYDDKKDYVEPGTYNMTIKAWDNNGNITYQKCKIYSADVTPPVITSIGEVKVKAKTLLTKEEIIACFSAVDEHSNVTLRVAEDGYTANYMDVGVYNVTVSATDEDGNVSYSSLSVNVEDSTPPTLTYTDAYISSDSPITEDGLRALIRIYDDVDGLITNYKIIDENEYFKHPSIQGEYAFYITCEDKHHNKGEYYIYLYVVDNAGPTIEAPKYTVMLNKGEKVTRAQILQILKATGQINSIENTTLYSLYFDSYIPEGEYDLEVVSDGNTFHDIIKFVEKANNPNIDDDIYNIPIKKEDKNNNTYYVVLGVSLGVIVILSVLGVVIYKKKH